MSESEPTARPAQGVEYPDAAGYPDGTGTLDEGTAAPEASQTSAGTDAADESGDVAEFAMTDEEDVDN